MLSFKPNERCKCLISDCITSPHAEGVRPLHTVFTSYVGVSTTQRSAGCRSNIAVKKQQQSQDCWQLIWLLIFSDEYDGKKWIWTRLKTWYLSGKWTKFLGSLFYSHNKFSSHSGFVLLACFLLRLEDSNLGLGLEHMSHTMTWLQNWLGYFRLEL